MDNLVKLWHSTGIYHLEIGQAVMILVGLVLLWLAIKKGFEPLLLVPATTERQMAKPARNQSRPPAN